MEIGMKDKTHYIRAAAVTAIIGNAALAAIKITTGAVTGSGALIADGFDSSADVLIGFITLAVVRVISKPADAKHPWGHGRAETVATVLLSFILFFMGAQLIINSAAELLFGTRQAAPGYAAFVAAAVSAACKVLLALNQYRLGKRADSPMLKANAKNMAGDALVSVGVLAGLAASAIAGTNLADIVIAMAIGAWIVKTAVNIFLETNLELMDGNKDTLPYQVIIDAVNSTEGAANPHRARMRRIAGFWDIDLDIDSDPKCTLAEAHGIASRVEREIKSRLENVFDIMIHVEPYGDKSAETFGLSEVEMRG